MRKIYFYLTVLLVGLIGLAAYRGIFMTAVTYGKETVDWSNQAVAQDFVNLFLVAPILVISSLAAIKGSMRGLLVWLGGLIATLYSFLIYAFSLHFGLMFPIYIAVVGLSLYLIIWTVVTIKATTAPTRNDNWSRKTTAILLIVLATMFYLLWSKQIYDGLVSPGENNELVKSGLVVNPVHVIDMAMYLPGLIIVGILLLRRRPWGDLLAAPLLVSMLIILATISFNFTYFKLIGVTPNYGMLPMFLIIMVIVLIVTVAYLRRFPSIARIR